MKKERTFGIIGIAFALFGLFFLLTTYFPGYNFIPSIPAPGIEYLEEIQSIIRAQQLIVVCIISPWFLLFFISSILHGVKNKVKLPLVLSVIGIALLILFVAAFFGSYGTLWNAIMMLFMTYSFVFSIVMLVRSFKSKVRGE